MKWSALLAGAREPQRVDRPASGHRADRHLLPEAGFDDLDR